MAIRVNSSAVERAERLIKGRQYEKESNWSQVEPTSDEQNEFIEANGWEAYSEWHLAYDDEENKGTKKRYRFPIGDLNKLHRSGLIAAKQRAAQQGYDEVEKAAEKLLEKFPEGNG